MPKKATTLVEKIFLEATKEYDYPIVKTYDLSQHCLNTAHPVGVHVRLHANTAMLKLLEPCVIYGSEFLKTPFFTMNSVPF